LQGKLQNAESGVAKIRDQQARADPAAQLLLTEPKDRDQRQREQEGYEKIQNL